MCRRVTRRDKGTDRPVDAPVGRPPARQPQPQRLPRRAAVRLKPQPHSLPVIQRRGFGSTRVHASITVQGLGTTALRRPGSICVKRPRKQRGTTLVWPVLSVRPASWYRGRGGHNMHGHKAILCGRRDIGKRPPRRGVGSIPSAVLLTRSTRHPTYLIRIARFHEFVPLVGIEGRFVSSALEHLIRSGSGPVHADSRDPARQK